MNRPTLLLVAWLTAATIANTSAVDAALTIEQAEQLSKRTGRPILAVAGSKT